VDHAVGRRNVGLDDLGLVAFTVGDKDRAVVVEMVNFAPLTVITLPAVTSSANTEPETTW
jgi:hypothetical protein